MEAARTHEDAGHVHGPTCGHQRLRHNGHVDYLHNGHLHHPTAGGGVEDHAIDVGATNPADCTPGHSCDGHDKSHRHNATCGHAAIPHGDHVDYLVHGHLHKQHGGHCDDHGPVALD